MVALSKKTLRKQAVRAAQRYDAVAQVEHNIATRLDARLALMKIDPARVLNCGANTGFSTRLLRARYPKAQIISTDLSLALLLQTPKKFFRRHKSLVCTDPENFGLKARSFDLIFSNLTLTKVDNLPQVLREFYQLLRPQGLLLFTTCGPDTLKELRAVSQAQNRVHDFIDMHDVGDALLAQKFQDPVMDMEILTLHYKRVESLFSELKTTGNTNARLDRAKGLQGRHGWQQLMRRYQDSYGLPQGGVSATLELIYGHAWLPEQPDLAERNEAGEVVVPLSTLKSY